MVQMKKNPANLELLDMAEDRRSLNYVLFLYFYKTLECGVNNIKVLGTS